MLVSELIKKINFHDSCVKTVIHTENVVRLNLDLCMWQQKEYKDDMPELKEIILKFINVTNYNWDSEKSEKNIEYESIVKFTYDKNIVCIVLEDEEVSILTFECAEIQIE